MGIWSRIALAGALLLVTSAALADGSYRREHVSVENLHVFGTGELTNGAVILTRDFVNGRINADLTSISLVAGDAYSIWWVIFNYPENCATPHGCMGSDINGSPKARATAIWAGGFVADQFGDANTSFGLVRGRTEREVLVGTDVGLRNMRGAEIHVVVRTHGPAGIAGPVAQQIGTANEACPGGVCTNEFFSVHRAPMHMAEED